MRQVVSSYLYKEGRIHYTKGKPQHQDIRVDLDISSVIDKIRYRIKLEETANKILIDIPHVTLTYEKDLIDEEKQEKAYSLLLDMLKLRKIPRASRYHKGDDVLNSVVNINDIKEELRKIDLC